ncbi:hypothetical protein [Chryseobacterium arthrosphaerae]|uniref:hypothetical protein n=1 Tax=Chryseobacterium arthrosphaerae TaxID=651561 RepID=UPI00241E8EC2|nr:hypothetical protein [Chryseobacterium arthrosphaerae]
MKKLILLTIMMVSIVSCERDDEKVDKNLPENKTELFNKITANEKISSTTASDTISVKNVSSDAGTNFEDPISEVDPKDIVPPRR